MQEKIFDHEIEEILKDHPRNLTSLSEILIKLEKNRKIQGKDSVSKTTVFAKLEKMVHQKKIHHVNRKGYKLLNYEFTNKDPNFRLFEIYKKVIGVMGYIQITKMGKLNDQSEAVIDFNDSINPDEWDELKNNYKRLIDQGILELKQFHKKQDYFLSINYDWALYHDICPSCLKSIDLNKPHFVLEFIEDEAAYLDFTKTHIQCIEMFLDQHELKREYEGEPQNYNPFEEFNLEYISNKSVGITCPYCGLTFDLYELFFNEKGPLEGMYKKFQNENKILEYLQNVCKELYGDISTLIWAKKISFKNVRLVIKKVVMIEGTAYHPNCAINAFEQEKMWDNLSNKLNKEGAE